MAGMEFNVANGSMVTAYFIGERASFKKHQLKMDIDPVGSGNIPIFGRPPAAFILQSYDFQYLSVCKNNADSLDGEKQKKLSRNFY